MAQARDSGHFEEIWNRPVRLPKPDRSL